MVVILPGTDVEVALQIAERVRARTEASWEARQPKVTVSLGIASTRDEATGDVILKRADIALYEAKAPAETDCAWLYDAEPSAYMESA